MNESWKGWIKGLEGCKDGWKDKWMIEWKYMNERLKERKGTKGWIKKNKNKSEK